MDRRSWLWRRKSTEKSPGETDDSLGASISERFFDEKVYIFYIGYLLIILHSLGNVMYFLFVF